MFAEVGSGHTAKPGWSLPRIFLLFVSAAMLAATICALVLGFLLLRTFPKLTFIAGILLILVGFEVRPRVPKLTDFYATVERKDAPNLFSVFDQIAAAVGSKPLNTFAVDQNFNAGCGRSGLLRKRVLILGLPLWGALSPEGRVALLGHEFGHLINGDPDQALLTQPALTTFGRIAVIAHPNRTVRASGVEWVSEVLARLVLTPVFVFCLVGHYLMLWVGMRESQRAEYLADRVSLGLAGSAAANELADALLYSDSVLNAVRRSARLSPDPALWHAAATAAVRDQTPSLRIRQQLSTREDASLWQSHPPSGLRSKAFRAQPESCATLAIDACTWKAADDELAAHYKRVARALNS